VWVRARLCKFQKMVHLTRTTKTGRRDIAEILLKVALSTKNKSINHLYVQ
jgi:hypothetical protein